MKKFNDGEKILLWILALFAAAAIFPIAATYTFFSVIVGLCVLLALVFAGMVGYIIYNRICNTNSPVVRVSAIVIRKRHFSKDISFDPAPPEDPMLQAAMLGSNREEAWKAITHEAGQPRPSDIMLVQYAECFITFRFNGREEEFRVPAEIYVDSPEGIEGLLVYQGEIFKHFILGVKDNSQW